jgi:hypothetical protein
MAIACKLCIAQLGLKAADIPTLPQSEDELITHLKEFHGITVRDASDVDMIDALHEARDFKGAQRLLQLSEFFDGRSVDELLEDLHFLVQYTMFRQHMDSLKQDG